MKKQITAGLNKENVIVKSCLLILLSIVVGALLITAANYLPVNASNKQASLKEIGQEGLFPEVPGMKGEYGNFHSMNPTALELATDSLMLKMALYEGEGAGIKQAFRCYSTQYEEEYSRYWHGYVVVLRVLLLFLDYYEIRILNYFAQLFLFIMLVFYLWKNKGIKYALALASSYILLMPMALSQCLQYTWAYYVTFVALLVYMYFQRFWESGNRYIYFFVMVGVTINYVDLLTYPLLSWGLVVIWWLLLQNKEDTVFGHLKKVVCSGIAWIAGYAGMWVGKWMAGSLVLRENLFRKAISEALLWTVNEGDAAITAKNRLEAIYINWNTYDYKFYLIILVAWLVFWIVHSVLFSTTNSTKAPALLLVACSGVVWYLVLAGHAIMHHIFTHRTFGVSIAAFIGMILLSTNNHVRDVRRIREVFYHIGAFAIIFVFSAFLMTRMRDAFFHHNGGSEFDNVIVSGPVQTMFTPIYADVTHIHLGFSIMNGTEGYCRVQLSDQGEVLEESVLPFTEYAEGNFHQIEVNWKLQAGHTYIITLEPVDLNGEFCTFYTSDGSMPLPEFGELTIGGEEVSSQLLAGVTYWCELTDMSMRLLYIGTYMAICLMVWYSVRSARFYHSVNNYFRIIFKKSG